MDMRTGGEVAPEDAIPDVSEAVAEEMLKEGNPGERGKSIKIHVLQCGRVNVDTAMAHKDVSPFKKAYTGRFRNVSKREWLPVNVFLIEAPKGLVLVDAGWHTDVRVDPKVHESPRLWSIYRPDLPEGQAVTEQLAKLGYQPSDIDYVVMTSLDVDHASGLSLLKGAKHIVASQAEIDAARTDTIRYNPVFIDGLEVEPISYIFSGVGPSEMTCDLFGDGMVQLVYAPGKSAGSQCVLVHDQSDYVLLVGDSGYDESSWETERFPGLMNDRDKTRFVLTWIKTMQHGKHQKGIFATHDPAVKDGTVVEL